MRPTTPVTADLLRGMTLPQPREGGKEERGRVMVVGGSVEVPGAVLLAATAALRAGAGKLQVATVKSLSPHLGLAVPEALVMGLPETPAGGIAHAAEPLIERAARCDAVLIGPGMVEEQEGCALVGHLLAGLMENAVVLDAAALCGLHDHRESLVARPAPAVLTPHAGEMAQLLGRSRDSVEADPLAAAREAAASLRVVVVMKGGSTHIVTPDGEGWLFEGGHVGLATSGSGDVLAGLLVGLLARGASPLEASLWAVYLHGTAGALLARAQGGLGLLARELAAEVPAIMAGFDADT